MFEYADSQQSASQSPGVLGTALAFAKRGIGVFPCHWPILGRDGKFICSCGRLCGEHAAKHPYAKLAPRGCYSATIDTGVLKHWFSYVVPEANLAIHADGLIIVDTDPRHGGDESFAALEREHGEFPKTWRCITGSLGHHDYFSAPDGVAVKNIVAETMENPPLGKGHIRTRGGYVITPPSRHMSGRKYEWSVDHHPSETPLAVAPAWLIERLTAATTTTPSGDSIPEPIPSNEWARLTRQPITEYRDMAAAKIAGHLLRHSCDYQLVLGMMHAWNSAWCKPQFGYHELNRIIDRIATREAERIERGLAR